MGGVPNFQPSVSLVLIATSIFLCGWTGVASVGKNFGLMGNGPRFRPRRTVAVDAACGSVNSMTRRRITG